MVALTWMQSEWFLWTSSRESWNSSLREKSSSFLSLPLCCLLPQPHTRGYLAEGCGNGAAGTEISQGKRHLAVIFHSLPLCNECHVLRLKPCWWLVWVSCQSNWITDVSPSASSATEPVTFGTSQAAWCTDVLNCFSKITLNVLASN